MKAYTEQIPGTGAKFDVLPIPGGTFLMGSPKSEADHRTTNRRSTKSALPRFGWASAK